MKFITKRVACLGLLCLAAFGFSAPLAAEERISPAAANPPIADLDQALAAAAGASSPARQRLAMRRVIRDAEELLAPLAGSPDRFPVLEFLFRARQRLVAVDDDTQHRMALLETARELVKAPDEQAGLRVEADLLLSQAELAKQGADAAARAEALRPFVARYIETPAGAKVVRIAMVMALELGDTRLVNHLRGMIEQRFAADLEMIAFQRDKLGGQVFGAPFSGAFKRSDGKLVRFPMDTLGRSTMCLFWSKEDGGPELIKQLAAAAAARKDDMAGRLEIISFNLDELPDAGESILRGLGAEWQALHLPGGRKSPTYDAYVRSDPRWFTVSPTGQAAMVMSGSTRKTDSIGDSADYTRIFQSNLAKQWTEPRYVMQFASLTAGDFLVLDPMGGIDPARPPEWKALTGGEAAPLPRGANAVPEETLRAIQECFIPGPQRYRMSHAEARSAYAKAAALCRQAIAAHPQAPDLWIVRNRLVVALLGLWKTDADLAPFEEAVAVAQAALEAGCPPGCDVIPRFVLARDALRQPDAVPQAVVGKWLEPTGSGEASGPALAAAAMLCLDAADRRGFERYRGRILKAHAGNPMMWVFNAFLLDRHHRYWLFQVPFSAGWSYGRREDYFLSRGEPDDAERRLETAFETLDGQPFRIPQAGSGKWTVIAFVAPWEDPQKSPFRELVRYSGSFAAARPGNDVQLVAAVIGGEAAAIRAALGEKPPEFPVLTLPGGLKNPVIAQLGIVSEDQRMNLVVLRPDGTIATTFSGLVPAHGGPQNVIEWHDEQVVTKALEQGKLEQAKQLMFTLAPPFDPEAVDEKGRKLKAPQYSIAHLRARARVYAAMEQWDKALADAEQAVERQLGIDGGMSMRTDELDVIEALRDQIRTALDASRKGR
ncbi:MAG: hypothetical protein ACO3JG_07925 [Luteolibacter sp.]